jgi:hypothetical protein
MHSSGICLAPNDWAARPRACFEKLLPLKAAIEEFMTVHNDDPKPFVWTKSADEILASIARFATRTSAIVLGSK